MSKDYTSKNAQDKNRKRFFLKKKLSRERQEKEVDDDYKRAFEND